jgi:hypothetical protein
MQPNTDGATIIDRPPQNIWAAMVKAAIKGVQEFDKVVKEYEEAPKP